MMYNYKYVPKLKINNFLFMNENPFKGAKTDFCIFFFTNIGGFFIMKEVVFKIYNFNSLFRGVKAIF